MAAVSYVELNPVRAGIVKKSWVYPWSSTYFHTGRSRLDPLVKRNSRGLVRDRNIRSCGEEWETSPDEMARHVARWARPAAHCPRN